MKSRVTIADGAFFQEPNSNAVGAGQPYDFWVDSDEQLYVRRQKVGTERVPMDFGWLKDASVIHIKVKAKSYQRVPTPEQRALDESMFVEVWVGEEVLSVIDPGRSIRLARPKDIAKYSFVCPNGEAEVTVHLFPK